MKFPVFWKFPASALPYPKSCVGSLAFPKWKDHPKSSRRRSRPAPGVGEARVLGALSGPETSPAAHDGIHGTDSVGCSDDGGG
ncbi:MAG: hypothetical protein ABSG96_12220 [Terracidiphilus sp.]